MSQIELPETGIHAFAEDGDRRVEVEWIGEGRDGDFDPSDADDYPHLRFNVLEWVGGEWEQMDDASYCCRIDARASDAVKEAFAAMVLEEVGDETRVKRVCERLSWTRADDVEARMAASSPRM